MTSEEFLERFNEGKISYKLPSKYPENFALCKSYHDGKREIPLAHKEKVEKILKESYAAIKPVLKKFKLSLALLIESEVTYKGVAWTKKIRVNFSNPTDKEKKEELIAYTNMIQIKIRNKDHPQSPKMFLNKTTVLAIMLHELAHLRHMHHRIEFALFLQEIYQYAMTLGLFSENEEHMIPSSRLWERRMFETKGQITREELDEFFNNINSDDNKDDSLEHEHGEGPEKNEAEVKKIIGNKSAVLSKSLENKVKSNTLKINKTEPKKEQMPKSAIFAKEKTVASSAIKKTATNTKTKITINLKNEVAKNSAEKSKSKMKKNSENSKGKGEEEVMPIKKKKKKAKVLTSEEVIESEELFENHAVVESNIYVNEQIITDLPVVKTEGEEVDKGLF